MKPVILGCSGHALTPDETAFFHDAMPIGYIIFARNIDTPDQLRRLTGQMRDISGDKTLIFIDQEGGRVQRMTAPHWRKYPPMRFFGELAQHDMELASAALSLNTQLQAHDLLDVGINGNCAPVLDIPIEGADAIIGDRAFARDVETVAALGRVVVDSFLASGVFPVIKHIPGHGRAMVDSHLSLPRVSETIAALAARDFAPFKKLSDAPFAMTAHILYEQIDAAAPATTSAGLIQKIIRDMIGFKGLLMTDDLSMKALGGSYTARTQRALEAGCDLILHCNGVLDEMQEIVGAAGEISLRVQDKLSGLEAYKKPQQGDDPDTIKARYDAIFAKI